MQTATSLDSSGFLKDSDGFVHVYTDGACSDNGRGSLSKAGIGVWWSDNHPLNLASTFKLQKFLGCFTFVIENMIKCHSLISKKLSPIFELSNFSRKHKCSTFM